MDTACMDKVPQRVACGIFESSLKQNKNDKNIIMMTSKLEFILYHHLSFHCHCRRVWSPFVWSPFVRSLEFVLVQRPRRFTAVLVKHGVEACTLAACAGAWQSAWRPAGQRRSRHLGAIDVECGDCAGATQMLVSGGGHESAVHFTERLTFFCCAALKAILRVMGSSACSFVSVLAACCLADAAGLPSPCACRVDEWTSLGPQNLAKVVAMGYTLTA